MRARTCVIAIGATLSACLFPDLGDLSGGDAEPADTSAKDVSANDVLTDPGPSDAPFCKRADHSLCDDFDEAPLGAAWDGLHVMSTTLASDDAASTSAPSSLLAIDPTGANTGAFAYLEKTFTGGASRVVCDFDVRVEKLGAAPVYALQLILSPSSTAMTAYSIGILEFQTKTQFVEGYSFSDGGTGGQNIDLSQAIAADAGAFAHVTFDAKLGASPSITLGVDGTTVAAAALVAPASTTQFLRLGIQEYFGTVARVRYDDLACDVTP